MSPADRSEVTIDTSSRFTRGWRIAAPVVLAFCGFLLITSGKAADGDDLRGSDILDFSDLVRGEEQRVRELEAQITELSDDIEQLAASRSDSTTDEVNRQAEEIMPEAGLTPVAGPALSVTLNDSPEADKAEAEGDDANVEDLIVHQQDLEGVINALWAGGAEAMMVMDQRMVFTSTIRCQGSILLLHGRTYYPPYTITAIGDTAAMRDALDASPAVATYRSWANQVGLGYDVAEDESVTIPAYTGTIRGGSTS